MPKHVSHRTSHACQLPSTASSAPRSSRSSSWAPTRAAKAACRCSVASCMRPPRYELLAIVHGRALDGGKRLPRLSAAWSSRLAVDVRLRGLTLRELRDVRPSLTWLDVVAGRAEVLAGPQRVLAPLRPPHPKDLPLEASAALLTDAATALAYAQLDGVTWEHTGPGTCTTRCSPAAMRSCCRTPTTTSTSCAAKSSSPAVQSSRRARRPRRSLRQRHPLPDAPRPRSREAASYRRQVRRESARSSDMFTSR